MLFNQHIFLYQSWSEEKTFHTDIDQRIFHSFVPFVRRLTIRRHSIVSTSVGVSLRTRTTFCFSSLGNSSSVTQCVEEKSQNEKFKKIYSQKLFCYSFDAHFFTSPELKSFSFLMIRFFYSFVRNALHHDYFR